jgi:hypothetical protein
MNIQLKTKTILGTGVVALLFSGITAAQEPLVPPRFQPVEMFTCDYNKGKSAKDLDKVVAKFNKWSDQHEPTGYTAWTLTPHFVNADIDFDIAWLGAWTDNATMGAQTDNFLAKGGAIQADFDRVLTCDSHEGAQAVTIKPGASTEAPENAVVMFSSCTLADGVGPGDSFAAHVAMARYMDSQGSKAATWAFYPGLGSGSTDFDYYMVTGYANYADMAATTEIMTNGGGWMEAAKIFAGVVSCDGPRSYLSQRRRSGGTN